MILSKGNSSPVSKICFASKRYFDLFFGVFCALMLLPVTLILAALVAVFSGFPVIYWSRRVGKDDQEFLMPKFRTMSNKTPELATHQLDRPDLWIEPLGHILRRTSLDELPQIWCIIRGDMSFVGPRPALYSQADLIQKRRELGISKFRPGLTGLAQINGRDELSLQEKVKLDHQYVRKWSFALDLVILFRTVLRVLGDKTVIH